MKKTDPQGTHTVIIAYSTGHVFRIEKVLTEAGFPCKMIPVPRHLSSDCGICIRIDSINSDPVRTILEKKGVEFEGMYEI
ncbi:MAG: DUF3343 domain-containing protein [Proteobacteria bacterium]|nr:DUF3343 domain-containing protein [Pseudomonadota bacterium]